MKVLLVCGSYPPHRCGVGDYTSRLAAGLSRQAQVHVDVLTSGNASGGEQIDGVTVWRCLPDWSLTRLKMLASLISRIQPDIVHVQFPAQGYLGGYLPRFIPLVSRVMGWKVLQTWHEGCPIRQPLDAFFKAIVAKEIVVVRPNFRQTSLHPWLARALGSKTFKFIPNASSIPLSVLDQDQKVLRRDKVLQGQKRLIVYFGFVLPSKGAELVFEIANPNTDFILIAGEMGDPDCRDCIFSLSKSPSWLGKSRVDGFLPSEEIASLLAIADAVVLPFRNGGGEWNTSIHAATMQGTFVLTTSATRNGYSEIENAYFSRIDNVEEMRAALETHAGTRGAGYQPISWDAVAGQHMALYRALVREHAIED